MTDESQLDVRRRLAAASRVVIDRLGATSAPADLLATAADRMEAFAETLGAYPHGRTYEGFAEPANSGNPREFFAHSPMSGDANPLAPPMAMEVDGDVVRATVTFHGAYEGPPGCVHGGFVAAAFDEVLGLANSTGGMPAMTGTLTIRYRRPTPLRRELRFEARLDRVEGRKHFCSAELWAGDELCAESDGIFVAVGREKFAELNARRASARPG